MTTAAELNDRLSLDIPVVLGGRHISVIGHGCRLLNLVWKTSDGP